MLYAVVTSFDAEQGLGSITVEGTGEVLPVRSTQIDGGGRQSLIVDSHVAFTLLVGPNGPHVANILVI